MLGCVIDRRAATPLGPAAKLRPKQAICEHHRYQGLDVIMKMRVMYLYNGQSSHRRQGVEDFFFLSIKLSRCDSQRLCQYHWLRPPLLRELSYHAMPMTLGTSCRLAPSTRPGLQT